MSERLEIDCPCCKATLVVDAASGAVISHEAHKKDPAESFEDAMQTVRSGEKRREDAFSKAFQRQQNLDDVLSKKFEEAKRKAADKKGEKPLNPLDFD